MRQNQGRPLRVLHAIKPPREESPFTLQITRYAPDGIQHGYMTPMRMLKVDFDVLHLHWPEILIRHPRVLVRLLRYASVLYLLSVMSLRRKRIVRTLHNAEPHESASYPERLMLRLLDWRTEMFVTMNAFTPVPFDRPYRLIPHGHYVEPFHSFARGQRVAGRILFAGIIRPYKGVPELLRAFLSTEDPRLTLRIVGKVRDVALRDEIIALAGQSERVSLKVEFLSDAELVKEISEASLLALPYKDSGNNSGMVLAATSLSTPVLVPGSDLNRSLQDEIGRHWVRTYEGDLTSQALEAAVVPAAEEPTISEEFLVQRSWRRIARAYTEVYGSVDGRDSSGSSSARTKRAGTPV